MLVEWAGVLGVKLLRGPELGVGVEVRGAGVCARR